MKRIWSEHSELLEQQPAILVLFRNSLLVDEDEGRYEDDDGEEDSTPLDCPVSGLKVSLPPFLSFSRPPSLIKFGQ